MYCQGTETSVKEWVSVVHRLRYKDFQLVVKPAAKEVSIKASEAHHVAYGRLEEVESVKEFGARMEGLGLWNWWRRGMGFAPDQ